MCWDKTSIWNSTKTDFYTNLTPSCMLCVCNRNIFHTKYSLSRDFLLLIALQFYIFYTRNSSQYGFSTFTLRRHYFFLFGNFFFKDSSLRTLPLFGKFYYIARGWNIQIFFKNMTFFEFKALKHKI